MKRTERYKNILCMVHRLHELQDAKAWTTAQFRKAITLLDEPHPYTLHLVGECPRTNAGVTRGLMSSIIAFEPVFRAQASPELLQEYGDLIANTGIIGYALCCLNCDTSLLT